MVTRLHPVRVRVRKVTILRRVGVNVVQHDQNRTSCVPDESGNLRVTQRSHTAHSRQRSSYPDHLTRNQSTFSVSFIFLPFVFFSAAFRFVPANNAKLLSSLLFQTHNWVTQNGTAPLPSEEENCVLVEVSEEEVLQVVKSIPKLDTLILIKTMLRKHSFQVS